MTRDELLAAAELVRNAGEIIGSPYPHEDDLRPCLVACAKLARHVQRLYDPTPVDEAWFESVGAEWVDGYGLMLEQIRYYSFPAYDMIALTGSDSYEMTTRGDVRRLCDALGIELREDV